MSINSFMYYKFHSLRRFASILLGTSDLGSCFFAHYNSGLQPPRAVGRFGLPFPWPFVVAYKVTAPDGRRTRQMPHNFYSKPSGSS
jgi:hypothetical protein